MALPYVCSCALTTAAVCLGTMTFGKQNTEAEAHQQLSYSWDLGINFLDTSEMYPVRLVVGAQRWGSPGAAHATPRHATPAYDAQVPTEESTTGQTDRFICERCPLRAPPTPPHPPCPPRNPLPGAHALPPPRAHLCAHTQPRGSSTRSATLWCWPPRWRATPSA